MAKHTRLSAHLPPAVAERLGWYVYLYVDPRTNRPFYVGKGRGERVLAHLKDGRDSDKVRLLSAIRSAGLEPRLEVLAHRLKDEETALRIEAAAIDLLGLSSLSNEVRGWKSLETGRMTLEGLIGYYAAAPVEITHPVVLIRINRLYRHNMTARELYDATRGRWKLGPRRNKVKFALAVFEGVVREVYEIQRWHPAHATGQLAQDDPRSLRTNDGRWEFTGKVARPSIRRRYRLRSVRAYFRRGLQSPTLYVNA